MSRFVKILSAASLLIGLVSGNSFAQQTQCVSNALAGGTVDAITIPMQPCGLSTNLLILTAAGANTGATTLRMAGGAALPVQDSQGNALIAGEIPGAGAVVLLTSTGSAWKIVSGNATTGFSGTLTVPNGGTGVATIPTNRLMVGQGTGAISTVAAGTTGQYLVGNTGSPPSWATVSSTLVSTWSGGTTGLTPSSATSGAITLAGTLDVDNGGTGLSSYTTGDLLYASGAAALSKLGIGSSGQYLRVTGGLPAWSALTSDAVTSIDFGSTGLTPATPMAGAVSVAGTLGFANGGTGQTSYTNGQLLIGNTSTGGLSKSTLTAGANMIITNSAGGITLASTGVSSGCGTLGSAGQVLTDNGIGGCDSNTDATFSAGTLSLGINTSEAGAVRLFGSTSGNLTVKAAAAAGASTVLTLPGGTTDFSATGGTNQVLKQNSAGAAFTVGTLACANLSDGATGCSTATGTSGATIPLLNAANTWSGLQTYSAGINLSGASSPLQVAGSAGTSGYLLTSAGAGATPTWNNLFGTANTWTAKQLFAGTSSNLAAGLANAAEPATISATAATGTINYDICTQSILYYTSNAAANWTLNLRCSSGTSLNTAMATGDVVTVTFLVTQGGTAYYNSAVQVDGGAVTPKYQGGTAWSAGNINAIDAYTYAIVKTGNAAFTVLAAQTQFK